MATLDWHKDLELHIPVMDKTHREFVDMLAAVEAVAEDGLLSLWCRLITHTEDHFAAEDRWMQATGFAVSNCHSTQHKVVLDIMREAHKRALEGDLAMLRGMLPELASWFNYHAQTMDAALAQHMQSVGYDPETGALSQPQALPQEVINGCGGACSAPGEHVPHAQAATPVASALA